MCLPLASYQAAFNRPVGLTGGDYHRGLKNTFLGFNIGERTAQIFDSGNAKFTTSTLHLVGQSVAAVLRRPAESKNRRVYVGSFTTSQNEVLAVLEKATGAQWKVEHITVDQAIENGRQGMANGEFQFSIMMLLRALIYGGDKYGSAFGHKLDNQALGLPTENLEEVTTKIVKGE